MNRLMAYRASNHDFEAIKTAVFSLLFAALTRLVDRLLEAEADILLVSIWA